MRRFSLLGVIGLCLLLAGAPTQAQQNGASRVQQDATMLNACSPTNQTAAVNTQVTVTLTPPSGQSVYICGVDLTASQNGTATANTNSTFTSTNLGGWLWKYSIAATANLAISQAFYFSQPMKSVIPGTAVTIVSPAALAQTAFSINVYYYFAP
jgi:hypothetical protein